MDSIKEKQPRYGRIRNKDSLTNHDLPSQYRSGEKTADDAERVT